MALLVVLGEAVVLTFALFVTVWLGFVRSRGLVLIKTFAAPKESVPENDRSNGDESLLYDGCAREHACSKAPYIKCRLTVVVGAANDAKDYA